MYNICANIFFVMKHSYPPVTLNNMEKRNLHSVKGYSANEKNFQKQFLNNKLNNVETYVCRAFAVQTLLAFIQSKIQKTSQASHVE